MSHYALFFSSTDPAAQFRVTRRGLAAYAAAIVHKAARRERVLPIGNSVRREDVTSGSCSRPVPAPACMTGNGRGKFREAAAQVVP
jgi:hypothetical protein